MNGIKRLIRDQPTIAAATVRQILLACVALGLGLTEVEIVAVMLAVEAVLTTINWILVTPVAKAEEAVAEAKADARAEAIVGRAMSPDLTPEEWASLNELRAERDALRNQRG